MRYLAVLIFLAGCGSYDADSFEEMMVCFEDGSWGARSKMNSRPEAKLPRMAGGGLFAEPDVFRGNSLTAAPKGVVPLCVRDTISLGDACYRYTCNEYCDPFAIWPPCGSVVCDPHRHEYVPDPGYPEPLEPDDKEGVR